MKIRLNSSPMKFLFIAIFISFNFVCFTQENSAKPEVTFNFLYNQTKGSISDVEIKMDVNWNDISKSEISGVAHVDKLTTENNMRDKHLKSEDFFHAEAFPTIKFVCRSMEKNGERYLAKGDLTIKETTQSVNFIVVRKGKSLVWMCTIDLSDFGINVKKGEGKNKVDVRVVVPL